MMNFKNLLLVFSFCFMSVSAYGWQNYPYPINPQPYFNPYVATQNYHGCSYQTSSICTTQSGQCSIFASQYQPNWFSACVNIHPWFHACANTPTPFNGNVVFRQQCALRGSSCVCSSYINGFTYYEAGIVY